MSTKISGSKYAAMYGPTTGDKVRLADTNLVIEVEKDYTTYGDEVKFGGGKTIRDGMGQSVKTCSKDGDLDLVITNALIVDSTGIVKADIGIKDGRIAGIGKAGNPDTMDGVTRDDGRSLYRSACRRRDDLNCRWNRYSYTFYQPTADRLCAVQRCHYNDRRRNRPCRWHKCDYLYAWAMEFKNDVKGC